DYYCSLYMGSLIWLF
nr:immunoglobulin light chain junction region [Macaca mulatta]MOW03048.1 immunoglobulin light chain junction region [Macaca mulatta]